MTQRLICKHGNPVGVTIDPAEFYIDGIGRRDQIVQRVTMPVCDQCLVEAVGEHTLEAKARLLEIALAHAAGESTQPKKEG